MIKDIILNVSRSYTPYVAVREMWGAGQTIAGELDNDFNARKFMQVGSNTDWEFIDQYGASIGIKSDGTIWTWGTNTDGRLGFGDSVNRSFPTQLGSATWVSASAGSGYIHAISTGGTLWGWGSQAAFGAVLGDGTATTRNSPVQIGTRTWKSISNGLQSSIAIRSDDTVWGWGGSNIVELGNGEAPGSFGIINDVGGPWNDVAVNRSYTIAVKSDGKLYGWGLNTSGQLGTGDVVYRSSPVQIGTLSTWVSASNNTVSVLAIKNDGTLWGWGASTNGVLGLNDAINRSSPVQVGTLNNWKDVSVSISHTIAIKTDGSLWSWGANNSGELGNGVFQLLPASPDLTWASASFSIGGFVHALKTNGTLWGWGSNGNGELGINDVTTRSSPVQIGTRTWKQFSNGANSTIAIRDDDTLWSFGRGLSGELGLNIASGTARSSPVQIGTRTWKYISLEQSTAFAIRNDNTLWGWGANNVGQLGLDDTISRSSPVQTGNSTSDWSIVFGGVNHTLAIKTNGTLWGWGRNLEGQLGLDDTINRSSPVQIGTRTDWSSVHTLVQSSFARRSDGTIWSWGSEGTNGLLGLNSTSINRSSPVQIGTRTDWSAIYTDGSNLTTTVIAKTTNGALWVWGSPSFYNNEDRTNGGLSSPVQIGTRTDWNFAIPSGDVSNKYFGAAISNAGELYTGPGTSISFALWNSGSNSSPVQIGTETNWASISAKMQGVSSALKTDGTLWTWGNNFYGFNTNYRDGINLSEPKQSTTDTWLKIETPGYLNLTSILGGIKTNGTLWMWGLNTNGQIGDGTTVTRSSPVQIGTRLWSDINIGDRCVTAIRDDGTLWGWGLNTNSRLGLVATTARSSPVQIGDKTDWYKIFAGETHSAGIRTAWNYDLYTAGVGTTFNATYEGINGWTYPRKSPIQLNQSNPWREIYSGVNHFMAIKTDGTLWGWGTDAFGQLGTGTTATSRSSPVQIGTRTDWYSISAGAQYTFGLRNDGTLWGWGVNSSGELGLSVSSNRSSPVQIGTRIWSKVLATSQNASIAVRDDGTLWSWGALSIGANTAVVNRSSPVQVGTETNWLSPQNGKSLSGTGSPVFARKTNKSLYVYAAGEGVSAGISFYKSSPVQVTSTRTWKSVHAGTSFTIAISTSGSIWGWGTQANGVIGNNTVTAGASQESPVQIGTLTTWVSASAGDGHVLAVRNDGTMWGWGINNAGQLGLLDTVTRSSPVQIGTLTNWSIISAGRSHTMAIKTDGTLWAWGLNVTNSQLGDGTAISRSSPVQIGTRTWTTVSAGVIHSAAIRSDATLWTWGNNGTGQLGDGTVTLKNSPVQVGTRTWTDVAAGPSMTMAVRSDGTLWTWGLNTAGHLGLLIDRSRPNYVVPTTTFNDVRAGYQSVVGKATIGTLWSWGNNVYGNLGLGDTTFRSSPVQIGTLTWDYFSNGGFHVCAIKGGELWSWGDNSQGQLGLNLGVTALRSSPVQVGTLTDWSSVDNGYLYSLAIKTDATLWAWGYNSGAPLGDTTQISKSSPVQIGTLNNWSKVGAGYVSSHAIKTDGTLWGWGRNNEGQLGDGTSVTKSSPVQIGTRTWTLIADKGGFLQFHTMAIRSDGTLWSWGLNTLGQLGLNNTTSVSSPVQIGTRVDWIYAAVGDDTSMAIRSDGTLWAWGLNSSAELGLGDTVNRSSPVQLGTLSSWVSASLGDANSVLLLNNGYALTTGIYALGFDTTSPTINRSSPVQIGIDTNWQKVKATVANHPTITNGGQFMAQKTDGTLWTWGSNTFGNLGDGTLIARSSPVQIGNETTWVDFSAEGFHFVGIKEY